MVQEDFYFSKKKLSQISILNYYVQHNSHSIAVSTLTKHTYKNLKRPSLATANMYSNASLYIMSRLISISWPNFTLHNLKAASSSKLEEGTQLLSNILGIQSWISSDLKDSQDRFPAINRLILKQEFLICSEFKKRFWEFI